MSRRKSTPKLTTEFDDKKEREPDSPPSKPIKRKATTFLAKFAEEMLSLPWEKVFAALMSGLILYIGASRLHEFSESQTKMKLELQRHENQYQLLLQQHRAEFTEHAKADKYALQMEIAGVEQRLGKMLKQEIKHLITRLESQGEDIHDLDKRLSLTEVRSQLQMQMQQQQQQAAYALPPGRQNAYLPPAPVLDESAMNSLLEHLVKVMVAEQLKKEKEKDAAMLSAAQTNANAASSSISANNSEQTTKNPTSGLNSAVNSNSQTGPTVVMSDGPTNAVKQDQTSGTLSNQEPGSKDSSVSSNKAGSSVHSSSTVTVGSETSQTVVEPSQSSSKTGAG